MFKFFRNKMASSGGLSEYEEVGEKKTTSAGYVLLVLMAVLLITAGEKIYSDLYSIPTRPDSPSYCAGAVSSGVSSSYYDRNCNWHDIDREFGLDVAYNKISPTLLEISTLNQSIQQLTYQKQDKERNERNLQNQYDVSLQEKMANEQVLFNRGGIQSSIVSTREDIARLTGEINTAISKRDTLVAGLEPDVALLKGLYGRALNSFERQTAVYQLLVFCLQLLFVLPFFAIAVRKYLSLKKNNSPYTIIATAVMGSSAFLLVQSLFVFIYQIIPHGLIEKIFKFFSAIPLFRYVLYYGTVLLVIAVFGGLVYLIQRRMFDTKKVAVRRLKENKCPGCSFSINPAQDFCPNCGKTLKEKCASCGAQRIVSLSFCPACGKRNQPALSSVSSNSGSAKIGE